jgi:RNA-splicing ligase RtcB
MMGKGKLIGLVVGLFLIGGGITYYIINNQTSSTQSENQEFDTKIINEGKKTSAKDVKSGNYDKKQIFSMMHEMSNTLIIARDGQVWGEMPIDKKNIGEIEAMIDSNNDLGEKEEERVLETLAAWKKGDFSNGVDEHNYFWDKLGGNIGRAKDLKPEYKK